MLVSAVPASASVITYSVAGVFNDGGSFTGGFKYDTATIGYSNVNVMVSGGSYAPITYTTIYQGRTTANYIDLGSAFRDFFMLFNPPLGGATSNIRPTSVEFVGNSRQVIVGTVTATDIFDPVAEVPEPAMLGLFGLGAIGLGLSRRRRKV